MKFIQYIVVSFALGACSEGEAPGCKGFECVGTDTAASEASENESASSDTAITTSADDDDGVPPPFCGDTDTRCLSDDVLQQCDEVRREIRTVSCSGVCGAIDEPSLGCGSGDGGTGCYCADPPEPCSDAGESECLGDGSAVRECEGGAWQYEDCDESCVAAGYPGAAVGEGCWWEDHSSGFSETYCRCRDEGASCYQDAQYCDASNNLWWCNAGTWQSFTCDTVCGSLGVGEGLACKFFKDISGELCACT